MTHRNVPKRKGRSLTAFLLCLRRMDFATDWDTVAGGDGIRTVQLSKKVDHRRTVKVQLCGDGHHRVSHAFFGCSDTVPTDFHSTTVNMLEAIRHECGRTDSKYWPVGSCAVEHSKLGQS